MLSFMDHRALNEKISSSQLKQLEKYLNNLFNDELGLGIDFTKHFEERVNDPRTKVAYGKDITIGELRDVFRDTARKFKSELSNLPKTANGHMINISNHVTLWQSIKNQIPFLDVLSDNTINVIKILITLACCQHFNNALLPSSYNYRIWLKYG